MPKKTEPRVQLPSTVPVLILKSTVLFPEQVASVQISTKPNLSLLGKLSSPDAIIAAGVFLDSEGAYNAANLGRTGVACRVVSRMKLEGGQVQLVLQGLERVRFSRVLGSKPYFRVRVDDRIRRRREAPAPTELLDEIVGQLESLVGVDERYSDELVRIIRLNLDNPSRAGDLVAEMVQLSQADRRRVLEALDVRERLELVGELLRHEIHRAQLAREVEVKAETSIDRSRRQELLTEQLEVIRQELAELSPVEDEIAELAGKVESGSLPSAAAEAANREIDRLRDSAVRVLEGAAIRAFVDWVLSLPWQKTAEEHIDLVRARRLLKKSHFGIGGARTRLLEFLAARKLGGGTLPLLAIVGPPGTGRTSLARTLAEILGRPLVRIPTGAIYEESQIRGKPRREVGAQPGRLLDGVQQCGVSNPVVLIDDIERLAQGLAPAMLDALDPARNSRFLDYYLGVPFDLSGALFVITANVEDEIPEPLWHCVDIITLSGYSDLVKLAIVKENVWPHVVEKHGLKGRGIRITPAAISEIISDYTREAGVGELATRLETVCRRAGLQITMSGTKRVSISCRNLEEYLGPPPYVSDQTDRAPLLGAVNGLAWTGYGGDLLPVEALLMPGRGNITTTGLLGEVMQESVQAALSYVRSRAAELEIPVDILGESDLHVHFPEGAIPKDGPSAGIAVATALASLLAGRGVPSDVAMTGEISLLGRVLPVGGILEKVLAAHRAGIRDVILPKANERDVAELPSEVRSKVRIHLVEEVGEVFQIALTRRRRSRDKQGRFKQTHPARSRRFDMVWPPGPPAGRK